MGGTREFFVAGLFFVRTKLQNCLSFCLITICLCNCRC